MNYQIRGVSREFTLLVFILSTFLLKGEATAQTCTTVSGGVDVNIVSSCSYLLLDGAGNVSISNGVTIGAAGDTAIQVTNGIFSKNLLVNGDLSGRIDIDSTSSLNQITNNGAITTSNGGINVWGNVDTIINNGTLNSAGWWGIQAEGGATIGSLVNNGSILAYSAVGLNGQILHITNNGIMHSTSSDSDINSNSFGPITLNNAQGSTNSYGPLTYRGILPVGYNIIISPTNYGKLDLTAGYSGRTTFGIYAGGVAGVSASIVTARTYTAVLSGINSVTDLNNVTTGTYGSYRWTLLEEGSTGIWDLIIGDYIPPPLGPSVANTNQSLVNTASVLQGTYSLQNSVMANSFTYDCNVFGANNVCVSAGGRNTAVSAANGLNNTSALLMAAYRPHPNYRIGAYADQNLSVSSPGGTVNLGNNTPLIGLFGVWNQRLNGAGTEVKVSAAYGQKNTTVTRAAVGSDTTASEAGSGSSTLNSQGAQVTARYGFAIADNLIVSPYVGVRYTQNNMGGYTEGSSVTVTAPLTYSALNTSATTALAGVGASYRVMPAVTTFTSVGVETDTNTSNGTYTATNASIGTLTPVNFNANPVRTRPTATLGAYYDIVKNQRLGVTGIYRQESYQAVSTTTVMATYTIGL